MSDIISLLFNIVSYGIGGLFILIFILFIFALIFGDRIERDWEYEATFTDKNEKKIGELDIEYSFIPKKEKVKMFKPKFYLRHKMLKPGSLLSVYVNDLKILEGTIKKHGTIRLGAENIVYEITETPADNSTCTLKINDEEFLSAPLYED